MTNFIESGDAVSFPAPYDRLSGEAALLTALFGIAVNDVKSGATGEFLLEGVFLLAKKAGDAAAIGARLYWDDTNKYVTTTSSGNVLIGPCVATAGSSDATVVVRLNGHVA